MKTIAKLAVTFILTSFAAFAADGERHLFILPARSVQKLVATLTNPEEIARLANMEDTDEEKDTVRRVRKSISF